MSSDLPTPEPSSGPFSPTASVPKPQRVLACVLCQQRKIKCDRRFPCANCTKAGASCVTAALPRQRRRRFPERELLDRLRHYEDLLRSHNIPFEPLHGPSTDAASRADRMQEDSPGDLQLTRRMTELSNSSPDPNVPDYPARNFWHAMNQKTPKSNHEDSDDDDESDSSAYLLRQVQVKGVWNEIFLSNEHLLFCSRNTNIDLATMHPNQAHIFKLWQIYLENVNPLLKVIHTPTLQARIIDAAGDVTNIRPPLEALMFSIYCIAVFTISHEKCLAIFGAPRQDVLRGYQLGAREALLNCDFLRSGDRDCLTALHLYTISVKPGTDPRALSALLGSAMRIAQLMGIHDESANAKQPVLEAEMRRRLWWSMVLFDARISEMTEWKVGTLLPTWDCKIPLNVNDFDIRSEMKNPPIVFGQPSESLFAVVRSEFGDYQRNCSDYLDFVNPSMKAIARKPSSGAISDMDQVAALERMFEDKYIQNCDQENPLHFMTTWTARGYIAKSRFMHFLNTSARAADQKDAQHQVGVTYALTMIDCDTKLMRSPLTKGFRWLIYLYFPFPAYIFLVDHLKKQPFGQLADTAWQVMSDNCASRFIDVDDKDGVLESGNNPFFKIFAGVILAAWAAREAAAGQISQQEVPPRIVLLVKQRLGDINASSQPAMANQLSAAPLNNNALTPESIPFGGFDSMYNMNGHGMLNTSPMSFHTATTQGHVGFESNDWIWPTTNWNSILGNGW